MLAPNNVPKSVTTGVPGWHTEAEELELITFASAVPAGGVIVELGGEYGRSASEFDLACKDKAVTIHTIDYFPMNHHFAAQYGGLLEVWTRNLKEAGLTRAQPMQKCTWEAASLFEDSSVDLLFIDAGHDYASVKRDLEAWTKKVKAEGVILCHDYAKNNMAHILHHEVKRAVDQWYDQHQDWQRLDLPDSLVAFVAPKAQVMTEPKPQPRKRK